MTTSKDRQYYVYSHQDPRNLKVLYVGVGQFDRAWNVRRNQRKDEHVCWLEELYNLGYTLEDIVQIDEKRLTKQEALELEKVKIEEIKPKFNSLMNPEYWHKGRKQNEDTSLFAKALHEMGYGYQRIAYLMGGNKNNHMSVKRMLAYVESV